LGLITRPPYPSERRGVVDSDVVSGVELGRSGKVYHGWLFAPFGSASTRELSGAVEPSRSVTQSSVGVTSTTRRSITFVPVEPV
jgi:hypothetical protein